jgi:hypothetical protein
MELKQYAELVEQMRKAQNQYFTTKSSIDLQTAKRIEKRVDEETEIIVAPHRIKNQQSLF